MVERVLMIESCFGILTAIFAGITMLQVRILPSRFGMLTAIYHRLSIENEYRNDGILHVAPTADSILGIRFESGRPGSDLAGKWCHEKT